MVIDLGLLRNVEVDTEKNLVSFGGGCTWADVDKELWKHKLATVGGTVSDTGVGGLILGGGYGFLSPKYGLSVDLLVECEMVTADGTVRIVSDQESVGQDEKDLFWALRGAGRNFGVVTRFTMRAFPQGEVYCGVVVFPVEQLDKLVEFANVVIERQDERIAMAMGVTHLPHGDALVPGLMSIVFYNGSEDEGRTFFAPLLEVAIADMTGLNNGPR